MDNFTLTALGVAIALSIFGFLYIKIFVSSFDKKRPILERVSKPKQGEFHDEAGDGDEIFEETVVEEKNDHTTIRWKNLEDDNDIIFLEKHRPENSP